MRRLIAAAVLAISVLPIHAATITVTSLNDSGPGTLRDALANAADGDTIDATGVSGTILLTSGELLVTNSVNIVGPGPELLAVNGNASNRVFHIDSGWTVAISSLAITNGRPALAWDLGGGIYNDRAILTVSNCVVSGNQAGYGSGVYNNGAILTVSNCVLSGNHARYGSGIYNQRGNLAIIACTLQGNSGAVGGAVYNDVAYGGTAAVEIVNSTLTGNSAQDGGGGVANEPYERGLASVRIVNSMLTSNFVHDGSGGAIENYAFGGTAAGAASGIVEIVNSTLSSNGTSYAGGGISNYGQNNGFATVEITHSTLNGNSARDGGGGVYNVTAGLRIIQSTISSNYAWQGGGALNLGWTHTASLEIRDTTFTGNSASGGSAIYNDAFEGGTAAVQIVNSTLSGNLPTNTSFGSDIYSYSDCDWFSDRCWYYSGVAILQIADSTLRVGTTTNAILYTGIYSLTHGPGTAIVTIASTVLDAGTSGVNLTNYSGTVTSLGYNLSSDDGGGFLTGPGDLINTDPMLGPLQDNGGPTFTCALLPGSPAINAGDPNFMPPPDFDQRGPGFPRVAYGRIDIGAFEVQKLPDSDGDGVPDMFDQCPNTPAGAIVDSNGCSIAQLVPCAGPATGGTWKNHGQYVAAVVHEATVFLKAGLITRRQWAHIVTQAAWSRCGWNRHCDRDGDRDWIRPWDCDRDADWGRERR